ncbi:hypothetical protein CONLIGDRAFT_681768 [Coniochaeta ligniaria NRRL 30616]|uniref:Uncharacterized protein n=1 Tax=Coniochaeta ligniaria NRRL 30616 TaxID=1408157 RepID=A0A1J7IN63_9PEZI|nr:hypothetical protein CONLIGDRAFT_681768 [Coniochaeta ligniaria NRRL 30616]
MRDQADQVGQDDAAPEDRSLNQDYSSDQLGLILGLWAQLHDRDLILGVLTRSGLVNIYENAKTTAATEVVWAGRTPSNQHIPLILPVMAAWLAAHDCPDFDKQKRLWAWAYNAATNTSILASLYGLYGYHRSKLQRWASWTPERLKAVLEMLRTGVRTAELDADLAQWPARKLFRTFGDDTGRKMPVSREQRSADEAIYKTPQTIAAKHGLSASEFEYYCTIESRSKHSGPVFYPFHALSKPEAKAYGWDQKSLRAICATRLRRLRTQCNRRGEAAGYGEEGMEATKLIYWLALGTCKQIQGDKGRA